jgi:hypothetical protein
VITPRKDAYGPDADRSNLADYLELLALNGMVLTSHGEIDGPVTGSSSARQPALGATNGRRRSRSLALSSGVTSSLARVRRWRTSRCSITSRTHNSTLSHATTESSSSTGFDSRDT